MVMVLTTRLFTARHRCERPHEIVQPIETARCTLSALLGAVDRSRSLAPNEGSEHVDVANRRRTQWVDDDFGGKIAGTFRLRPKRQHIVPPTVVSSYRVRVRMGPDLRWLVNEPSATGSVVAYPDEHLRVLARNEPVELYRDGSAQADWDSVHDSDGSGPRRCR